MWIKALYLACKGFMRQSLLIENKWASFPSSFDFYNGLVLKNLLLFLLSVFFHPMTIFISKHLKTDAEMTMFSILS